jgi:hypothetical protein
MQIDVFQRSVSDPALSIGLAQHGGTHYRLIASNRNGKVVRLEVWSGNDWIIDASPPPLSLRILIRERLGTSTLPRWLLTVREHHLKS